MEPMQRKIPAKQELVLAEGDASRITLPALMDLAVEAMYVDFRTLLEEAGITDVRPTHGCVFRFVHGDGMRLTELASLAGLTKQSVGEIVDDLAGLGYLERYPDPTDKRAKLIRLTEKGSRPSASASPSSPSSKRTGPRPSAPTASPPSAPSSKRSPWPKPPPPSPSWPAPPAPPNPLPSPDPLAFPLRAPAGPSESSRGRSSAG